MIYHIFLIGERRRQTNSATTGPCSDSCLWSRLMITVSSAHFSLVSTVIKGIISITMAGNDKDGQVAACTLKEKVTSIERHYINHTSTCFYSYLEFVRKTICAQYCRKLKQKIFL